MDMLPVESEPGRDQARDHGSDYGVDRAERLALGADEVTVRATCAQTGGALFAIEMRMPPGGGPPLMHRHAPGEVYHILRGEFAFYIGEPGDPHGVARRVTAMAGDVVPLAGGTPHTIRNESAAEAVAFVVHAPGAPMESFARAAVELAEGGRPDIEAVLALAGRHGIEMLGPIRTADVVAAGRSG